MLRRRLVAIVIVALVLSIALPTLSLAAPGSAGNNPSSTGVTFEVDKPVYLQGQEVVMTVANNLSDSITLSGGTPFTITKPNKETVYSPVSTLALVEMKAGESKTWTWDQKDAAGIQVIPGAYVATLSTSSGSFEAKFSVTGLRTQKTLQNPDPGMPEDRPFKDVTGAQPWGDPHVLALYQRRIVAGKGEGQFDPEGTLTRAEFVTMVLRAYTPTITPW